MAAVGGEAGSGAAGRGAALRRWGVRLVPALVSVALGVLALGPVLGPGFALRYDMVFVPDPPLSAASLGGGSGFARAVPSDAVVAALATVLPADAVQAIALLSVFVVGGTGAARLVPGGGWAPRSAAAVLYVWNPFVAERLLLGQWAMLLGYAGLPWVLAAVVRLGRARGVPRLVVALIPAAVGGFSSVVLSALVAGPAAVVRRGAGRLRALGWTVCALVLVSLPWLIPSLSSGARTDPAAVELFAARADGPFGAAGSLLVLGGVWNAQAVPEWYGVPVFAACRVVLAVAAVAGWVWLARGGVRSAPVFWPGLSVAAALGLGVALLGTVEPGRELLRALIGWWPGFGPLRDGQLFVAPLALLQAAGLGGAVAWVLRSVRRGAGGTAHGGAGAPGEPLSSSKAESGTAPPFGSSGVWTALRLGGGRASGAAVATGAVAVAVLLLAPVALLPGLAWGAAGRLAPVDYPSEWRAVRNLVDGDPRPGALVSLPWSAYRGLDWGGGGRTVVVLDPAVKSFDRRVVWNDDLRVAVGGRVRTVDGEDPLARAVAPAVAGGWPLRADPSAARRLGAAGVRYVLVDRAAARAALGADGPGTPGASPGTSSDASGGAGGGTGGAAGDADKNTFFISRGDAQVVHKGARFVLLRLPDDHVQARVERLSGLEVTGWFVTVVAILWSMVVSGSNLVPVRPVRSTGMGTWKENRK
ncbi:hypothetical protein CLV63_109162 [Murinocardiopsis flavida]|uniref:Membrane protein YfhO n=1 Tax=Murinocardiopsis flavida TaxID=645275 RepID=A0A2P8DIZ8_9ACTN|nr:hypothetical protein [Murinocardiopsis flavida]PSK97158.1 hypothetical protein CLV63_109162 [Murinocardiopsis flavida]